MDYPSGKSSAHQDEDQATGQTTKEETPPCRGNIVVVGRVEGAFVMPDLEAVLQPNIPTSGASYTQLR
jgi:hypothetical protein